MRAGGTLAVSSIWTNLIDCCTPILALRGTAEARRRCKAFPPGFTGMPRCVTSCGTRTACPGQPVSTLTAAGLRPYRSKALRHKLVPDALLTGVPTHRRQDAVPALCPKTTPSRRIQVIEDASAASLHSFVKDCIDPGSTVHTDGWQGYAGLETKGYQREITRLRGRRKEASELMPRVHRIASLLKRWILGTHQGAVAPRHLPYYLDEFTFRFNRRRSKSRGKLFFRLMQQAVSTPPATYDTMVKPSKPATQPVGVS